MLNIYDGTLGIFVDKDKMEYELRNLLSKLGDSLQYEFQDGDTGLVILTGKNEDEKSVIPFEHPFVFTGLDHRQYVAIDIRAFMKSNLSNMVTVAEGINDRYNGYLQLRRAIFNRMMLDGELDWFRTSRNLLMEAFSIILRQFTHIVTFDKKLAEKAELIAKLHFVTMDEEKDIDLATAVERLPHKTVNELRNGYLKDDYMLLTKLAALNKLVLPSRTIGSFVTNLKALANNDRAEALTTDLYTQVISRSFYSFDSGSLAIAFMEHIPSFIAIYFNVVTEGINSKSSMRKVINSFKNVLKPKDVTNILDQAFKSNIIS